MVVPLIFFALGCFFLFCASSVYRQPISSAEDLPIKVQQRDKLLWTVGFLLLALALMMSLAGYFSLIPSPLLRSLRVALGIMGVVLLAYQRLEVASRP